MNGAGAVAMGRDLAKVDFTERAEAARRGVVVVVGKNGDDGWMVSLMSGGAGIALLDAKAARKLAGDLTCMADICEGLWGSDDAE